VTPIDLLQSNEMGFCDFCELARKLASLFGHPTQVSTQVQLVATCDYLRVRLTRALTPFLSSSLVKWFTNNQEAINQKSINHSIDRSISQSIDIFNVVGTLI